MPKIEKILTLEITPEQFLNACSLNELYEIELLLTSAIKRAEMKRMKQEEKHKKSILPEGFEDLDEEVDEIRS